MSIQNNNSWNKKNYFSTSILRIIKIELNHRIGFNNDTVQH